MEKSSKKKEDSGKEKEIEDRIEHLLLDAEKAFKEADTSRQFTGNNLVEITEKGLEIVNIKVKSEDLTNKVLDYNLTVLEAAIAAKEADNLIKQVKPELRHNLLKIFSRLHLKSTSGEKTSLKPTKALKFQNHLMTLSSKATVAKSMFSTLKK